MMAKRGKGEGSIVKRKDGLWQGMVTAGHKPDGSPSRKYVYGKTRSDVAEKMTKMQHDINTGSFVDPGKLTLGQWLDTWLDNYKKLRLRPSTWNSYEDMARLHIKPHIGGILLAKLQASDLQLVYNQKVQDGLSSRTVHYIHQIINGALKQALKEQKIIRNVNEATELPPLRYKEIQPLTAEQVYKFLEVAANDRLYTAFLLELGTGLRRGELLALRWGDIDFENWKIFIQRTVSRIRIERGKDKNKTALVYQEPKTQKSKASVPIPEDIIKELKTHRVRQNEEKLFFGEKYQHGDLVFCTEYGRQLDPRNFTKRHKRLLQQAGLPEISFHNLRHTFASLLLEAGEEMRVIQECLRHTKISTTANIYISVSEKLKKNAASKVNEILKRKAHR
jgi:integrase